MVGTATFRGHAAVDVEQTTSAGVVAHTYQAVVNGFVETYGGTSNVGNYYFDPLLRFPTSLQLGESHTNTSTSHQSGSSVTSTLTMTYVARDTTTVPAGTFETCRLRMDLSGGPVTHWFNWLVASGPYRGLVVKQEFYDNGVRSSTSEATAISASFK